MTCPQCEQRAIQHAHVRDELRKLFQGEIECPTNPQIEQLLVTESLPELRNRVRIAFWVTALLDAVLTPESVSGPISGVYAHEIKNG